jgi:DNA ligase-1
MPRKKKLPILYHEARTGKLHSWEIWTEGPDIVEKYGSVDGKKTINRRRAKGKNVGKVNESTPEEQATFEAAAKHQKKLDKKYSLTKKGAKETVFLPMLAHDFRKMKKELEYPVDVQPKLDGVRCMAFWDKDKLTLMSRGGKEYDVAHVRDELEKILPRGLVLDGELYIHGNALQDTIRLVKKHREGPDGSIKLEYWVYDIFAENDTDREWWLRRQDIDAFFVSRQVKYIKKVSSRSCLDGEFLTQFLQEYEDNQFEGIIIRKPNGPYNLGHRSRDLIKLKNFLDEEFEIVGHTEASGNDKGTVVWTCVTKEGKEFSVRPTGTREDRAAFFSVAERHYGRMLTVKFQAWTKDKMPQFPVGVAIREPGE